MARIPDELLRRIREEVPLERLAESRGVELKRHGADLIGRTAGPARVVISHDVEHGLAEADLVLGLKAGRPALLEPAGSVTATDVRGLY